MKGTEQPQNRALQFKLGPLGLVPAKGLCGVLNDYGYPVSFAINARPWDSSALLAAVTL
jgi:hypothetical protein